jgi:hypothetical protein
VEEEVKNYFSTFFLEKNVDPYAMLWSFEQYRMVTTNMLAMAKEKMFSERSYDIVSSILMQTSTLQELSEKYGMTKERIRQIFNFKSRWLWIKPLEIIRNLEEENSQLKERIKIMNLAKVERTSEAEAEAIITGSKHYISEFDLPVRTLNCLKLLGHYLENDIKTLEELASIEASDILRIRNFGKKSLLDIIILLRQNNIPIKWNLKKLFPRFNLEESFPGSVLK